MAKFCAICGKGTQGGHNVSHSGKKTKKVWSPNLQVVRVKIGGKVKRMSVCTACLKKGLVKKPAPKSS